MIVNLDLVLRRMRNLASSTLLVIMIRKPNLLNNLPCKIFVDTSETMWSIKTRNSSVTLLVR